MREFWAKVNKDGPVHPILGTRCWDWTGGLDEGYGSFRLKGIVTRAHRVAWAITHGDPGALHVLHHCDNRRCCNPAHLFTGTNDVDDRSKKGPYKTPGGPRGLNGGRRRGAEVKKTPPTTVRFTTENHVFVREHGELHPDGQSGVINDAVSFYRQHVADHSEKIFATINGANGHGKA